MTINKSKLDEMLTSLPKRSLQSTLFNVAHAYARAANASWNTLESTKDADFAAPAIMCQSFAVELLLKFFLAIDHPTAKTSDELEMAGVTLKCHKLSELFDQLLPATQSKIAGVFTTLSGKQTDAAGFRAALIAQGDDPFVYWRYIYEKKVVAQFDQQAFDLVIEALGKAAEAERKATVHDAVKAFIIMPPNTACTRRVGVAAFFGRFLAGGWLRQSSVSSSRPPAGNAHR
jgi:hypothetical protein